MAADDWPCPAWMYRQSAALPYRWRNGSLEVLLITTRKQRRWIVPKGIVEPGLSPAASAAKEALEEAGVAGDMGVEPLGSYQRAKWGGVLDIEVYPMRVSDVMDHWEESALRRRRWFSVDEAVGMVEDEGLMVLIARLPDIAGRSGQAPDGEG